jgi:hypothetical protein
MVKDENALRVNVAELALLIPGAIAGVRLTPLEATLDPTELRAFTEQV